MFAECLESPGLLLVHLQAGNWFCHLPEAWRGLQEGDCLVQRHPRALSVFSSHSLREKPSCMHASSPCEGNLPGHLQLLQGSPATWWWSVRKDGRGDLQEGVIPALHSFVSSAWKEH